MNIPRSVAVAVLALNLGAATAAHAALGDFHGQIATFTAVGGADNVQWTPNPGELYAGTLGTIGAVPVILTFTGDGMGLAPDGLGRMSLLQALGPLQANLVMTTGCCQPYSAQPPGASNVTFTFTYTGATPLVVGDDIYNTGATLLRAGGNRYFSITGGSFQDGGYSSDLMSYFGLTAGNTKGSVAFTSTPSLVGSPYPHMPAFTTLMTGGSFYGGVPEPATWGLMIAGFGLTGAALRRRRQMVAT